MDRERLRAALSVREFAERIGLGRTKIYAMINAKLIKRVKCGRRSLIPISELEAFIQRLDDGSMAGVAR